MTSELSPQVITNSILHAFVLYMAVTVLFSGLFYGYGLLQEKAKKEKKKNENR